MKQSHLSILALIALVTVLLGGCTALPGRLEPITDASTEPPVTQGRIPSPESNRETGAREGITQIALSATHKPLIYLAPGDKLGGALSLIHDGDASEADVVARSTAPEIAHAEPLYVDGQRLIFRTVADALGQAQIWFETADGRLKTECYTVSVTPHGLPGEDTELPESDSHPVTDDTPTTAAPSEDEIRDGSLILIGVTERVENGDYARVQIQGKPGVEYDIAVYYSTTVSNAKGLGDKVADEDGYVTWTWKVGANTNSGSHRIVVSGGGEQITFYFSTHR